MYYNGQGEVVRDNSGRSPEYAFSKVECYSEVHVMNQIHYLAKIHVHPVHALLHESHIKLYCLATSIEYHRTWC